MLSKNGLYCGPLMLCTNIFFRNIMLALYTFEKLIVFTLKRIKTDFDLNNLVTVVVH